MSMQVVDLRRLCAENREARAVLAAGCLRCRDRQWLIGLIKQNLGEAGLCAGECRVDASGGSFSFPRRIVALFCRLGAGSRHVAARRAHINLGHTGRARRLTRFFQWLFPNVLVASWWPLRMRFEPKKGE